MKKNNDKKEVFILLVFCYIISSSLLFNGVFNSHDLYSHIARIYSVVEEFKLGQYPPVICWSYAKGFGYSWNLFYPPFSAYLGSLFYFFTKSYTFSIKLLIEFTIFFSAFSMYFLIKKVTKYKIAAIISSFLYISAPYFLTDCFIRLSLGEMMFFCFMPVLAYGLYNIFFEDGSKNYCFAIGTLGIILSHAISSIFAVIICFILIIFNIKFIWNKFFHDKKVIKYLFINCFFIITISLFFYLPFLKAKGMTSYVAFEDNSMGSVEMMKNHSLYLFQLIFTKFQYGGSADLSKGVFADMPLSVGIFILLGVVITPVVIKFVNSNLNKTYFALLLLGILSLVLTLNFIPWDLLPESFSVIQFPWRFLMISTFCLSIVSGINFALLLKNVNSYLNVTLFFFLTFGYVSIFLLNSVSFNYDFNIDYLYNIDDATMIDGGSKYCSSYEYLPTRARNYYFVDRDDLSHVINGSTDISNENKYKLNYSFEFANNKGASVEIPFVYYMGYKITYNGNIVNYYESDLGLIQIDLPEVDSGIIYVEYTGTRTQRYSFIISLVSFILFIIYCVMFRFDYFFKSRKKDV